MADVCTCGCGFRGEPMHWVFSSVGGQGSHHLLLRLKDRFVVGDKPDNALWMTLPGVSSAPFPDQGDFDARSGGYRIRPGTSLVENFEGYVQWTRRCNRRTAVFGLSAEFGLFTRFSIPFVVFLFRDPVDAYVSWAKPERHGQTIDHLGGIENPAAIDYYCSRWQRAAREYVALRDSGIPVWRVRFEHAREDSEGAGLQWVFDEFDSSLRNRQVLSGAATSSIYRRLGAEIDAISQSPPELPNQDEMRPT